MPGAWLPAAAGGVGGLGCTAGRVGSEGVAERDGPQVGWKAEPVDEAGGAQKVVSELCVCRGCGGRTADGGAGGVHATVPASRRTRTAAASHPTRVSRYSADDCLPRTVAAVPSCRRLLVKLLASYLP